MYTKDTINTYKSVLNELTNINCKYQQAIKAPLTLSIIRTQFELLQLINPHILPYEMDNFIANNLTDLSECQLIYQKIKKFYRSADIFLIENFKQEQLLMEQLTKKSFEKQLTVYTLISKFKQSLDQIIVNVKTKDFKELPILIEFQPFSSDLLQTSLDIIFGEIERFFKQYFTSFWFVVTRQFDIAFIKSSKQYDKNLQISIIDAFNICIQQFNDYTIELLKVTQLYNHLDFNFYYTDYLENRPSQVNLINQIAKFAKKFITRKDSKNLFIDSFYNCKYNIKQKQFSQELIFTFIGRVLLVLNQVVCDCLNIDQEKYVSDVVGQLSIAGQDVFIKETICSMSKMLAESLSRK
eukprot:EST49366.1 Hypothetical protein SS50377_10291 [Spironucleus salmonicida]